VIVGLACCVLPSCFESPTEIQLAAGGNWQKMPSGTTVTLHSVWGLETGEAFAVGDRGTVVHYDGSRWRAIATPTTSDLYGVWALDPENVVVTGDNGTALYYDGASWTPLETGTTARIGAMWGQPANATRPRPRQFPFVLYAVGGGPPGTILFFGFDLNYQSLDWSWQSIDTGGSENLVEIMGWVPPPNSPRALWRLMAVGESGSVRAFDGETWSGVDLGTSEDLAAVLGDAPGDVFVVGRGGSVVRNRNLSTYTGAWEPVAQLPTTSWVDVVARDYNDLFFIGAEGDIVNFDRDRMFAMRVPSGVRLNDAWAGRSVVFAVGDDGAILRYSGPPRHERCPINVRVTTTDGAPAVIDWSPNCPVAKLIVLDEWGSVRWFVEADGNLIDPGVTIGEAPAGTIERHPVTLPLEEGGLYRILLIRRDWDREIVVGRWNLVPDRLPARDEPAYFYVQQLQFSGTGPNRYVFGGMAKLRDGDWRGVADPAAREAALDIRPVLLEVLTRDADTGEFYLYVFEDVLAADIYNEAEHETITVLWDTIEIPE